MCDSDQDSHFGTLDSHISLEISQTPPIRMMLVPDLICFSPAQLIFLLGFPVPKNRMLPSAHFPKPGMQMFPKLHTPNHPIPSWLCLPSIYVLWVSVSFHSFYCLSFSPFTTQLNLCTALFSFLLCIFSSVQTVYVLRMSFPACKSHLLKDQSWYQLISVC